MSIMRHSCLVQQGQPLGISREGSPGWGSTARRAGTKQGTNKAGKGTQAGMLLVHPQYTHLRDASSSSRRS